MSEMNSSYSLKDYAPILKDVYQLALNQHAAALDHVNVKCANPKFIIRAAEVSYTQNTVLYKRLMSLDIVSIKVIANVMYIGRDYLNDDKPLNCPECFFNDWMQSEQFNGVSNWRDKSQEVEHICRKEKLLHRYLKKGMLKLGVFV